ncbi:hypothetical protein [Tetragenococcus solitarius]|nr:hypothetical protein [Tetragenococcus solitarius]
MVNATHIAWATDGFIVLSDYKEEFIEEGRQAEKNKTSTVK